MNWIAEEVLFHFRNGKVEWRGEGAGVKHITKAIEDALNNYAKLERYTKALRARLFMMQLEDTIGHPDWDAVNQEELEAFCDLEPWQRDGLK